MRARTATVRYANDHVVTLPLPDAIEHRESLLACARQVWDAVADVDSDWSQTVPDVLGAVAGVAVARDDAPDEILALLGLVAEYGLWTTAIRDALADEVAPD